MTAYEGLTKRDALKVAEENCDHASWWALNRGGKHGPDRPDYGCIHPDHGDWPFTEADPHSGLRLVDGKPTVYRPTGQAA